MSKISVVIPCFNEEEALPLYYREMCRVMGEMSGEEFELIFVDDGSSDRTLSILKEMNEEQIIQSIISTYNGLSIFSNHIYKNISSRIHFSDIPSGSEESLHFSPREKELIHYITQGLDNKEISKKMFLAEGTVRNNISKVLLKLNLKDRTQLAVFAVKNGLD